MSAIEFATNDANQARRHLNCEQMTYLTDETKQAILNGVKQGICRVRDPQMYGGSSGVVPETKDPTVWNPFIEHVQKLHDRDFENRPKPFTFKPGNLPDGYEVEWGHWMEDGHIFWWGTDDVSVRIARDHERPVIRYVGPAIPVQEGDDEPRD
ncbi:hypothetical protein [Corynebacterium sp. 805_CJEI]|uniref:hypothetical protein n=1 Tax=Corynebacterium sp. 805_CJEI TaxID=2715677 RepID=UPI0006696E7F|nr:hypothetical protein [Corynebacterium sp. 805_CJEI]